jgi:hypothetical protein
MAAAKILYSYGTSGTTDSNFAFGVKTYDSAGNEVYHSKDAENI